MANFEPAVYLQLPCAILLPGDTKGLGSSVQAEEEESLLRFQVLGSAYVFLTERNA